MAEIISYPSGTPALDSMLLGTELDVAQAGGTKQNLTRNFSISSIAPLITQYNLGYTSYVALLTQAGAAAPVATILSNTTGGTVTWTRTSAGVYVATIASSVFTANKTWMITGLQDNGSTMPVVRTSNTQITVTTSNNDDRITNSSFEVRIYS